MGLLKLSRLALLACLLPGTALALEWELNLDARLASTDADASFLHGGLGKLRYDDGTTFQAGRIRLALDQRLGERVHVVVDASSWGDSDRHPFDLTEAFVEYRPYPHNAWRTRLRAGAFYPPSSLENRASGWESPYSISSSALNTWIAEEIRAIGVEGAIDHLGSKQGGNTDWGLFAGVFGWNDPAGVLVTDHGFALHDRQTTLHGRVGQNGNVPVSGRQLFYEIDNRPGYYIGGKWKFLGRVEARGMHYDNRADASIPKPTISDYAWLTRFDTVGLRFETPNELTILAQALRGDTIVEPLHRLLRWRFDTWNLLLNQRWQAHAATLRFDSFNMHQTRNAFGPASQYDRGHAWTIAYTHESDGSPWRFMAEWAHVSSDASDRTALLGMPAKAMETKLELALRYTWSSHAGKTSR